MTPVYMGKVCVAVVLFVVKHAVPSFAGHSNPVSHSTVSSANRRRMGVGNLLHEALLNSLQKDLLDFHDLLLNLRHDDIHDLFKKFALKCTLTEWSGSPHQLPTYSEERVHQ